MSSSSYLYIQIFAYSNSGLPLFSFPSGSSVVVFPCVLPISSSSSSAGLCFAFSYRSLQITLDQ